MVELSAQTRKELGKWVRACTNCEGFKLIILNPFSLHIETISVWLLYIFFMVYLQTSEESVTLCSVLADFNTVES